MIGYDGLESAIEAGTQIFKKLRAEYPGLKGWLVLAHGGDQVGLTTNPADILANCGPMVVESPAKKKAKELLKEKKRLESTGANKGALERIEKDMTAHLKALHFVPEAKIELRFDDLRYDLVWALQTHSLVDQTLTPQTRASIRIVLGSIGNLCRVAPDSLARLSASGLPRSERLAGHPRQPATAPGGYGLATRHGEGRAPRSRCSALPLSRMS